MSLGGKGYERKYRVNFNKNVGACAIFSNIKKSLNISKYYFEVDFKLNVIFKVNLLWRLN